MNASWYVVAFTAISFAGLCFAIWFQWDAWRDLQSLREKGVNGNRGVIAHGNLRTGWSRLIVKFVFTMIGLTNLTSNPYARHWLIGGMLLTVVLLLVDHIYERWDRQTLLNAYRGSDS